MSFLFNKQEEIDPQKLNEYKRVCSKYPDRIPVIIKKGNKNAPDIDRNKYLVPKDILFGSFIGVIRQRLKLKPDEALFVMCDNTLMTPTLTMNQVYAKYKSKEGFLILEYSLESTFG